MCGMHVCWVLLYSTARIDYVRFLSMIVSIVLFKKRIELLTQREKKSRFNARQII